MLTTLIFYLFYGDQVGNSIDDGFKRWYLAESAQDDLVACICFHVNHEERIGYIDVLAVGTEFQYRGMTISGRCSGNTV